MRLLDRFALKLKAMQQTKKRRKRQDHPVLMFRGDLEEDRSIYQGVSKEDYEWLVGPVKRKK